MYTFLFNFTKIFYHIIIIMSINSAKQSQKIQKKGVNKNIYLQLYFIIVSKYFI